MSEQDDKTQRLVNLLKERDKMVKEEKKRRQTYKDDLTDVEDAIKELAVELDTAEKKEEED